MTAQPIETPRDRIHRRLTAIARAHGLTLPQMKSKQRFREFVAARREAYAYLHGEEGWSTTQIGRYFGRDHTTIVVALDNAGTKERRLERQRARYHRLINPWPEKRRERLEAIPQPADPEPRCTASQSPTSGISKRGGAP